MQDPWQPKPGDVIVRRPREAEIAPVQIHLTRRSVPVRGIASPMVVVYGFLIIAAIGTGILLLPVSNNTGEVTPFLTALFTAVSAVTVTGLVVVDSATYWSEFGQAAIFVLIFVGGLGFMTSAAFLLLLMGQRLGLQNQLAIREGLGVSQLGGLAQLVRNIVIVAIVFQFIGSFALFMRWYVTDSLWAGISLQEALWQSVFHSASSFNNAGFIIFPPDKIAGESVTAFSGDYVVLSIVGLLILLGGIGYVAMYEVVTVRRPSRLSVDTKVILVGTIALLFGGAALVFATEFNRAETLEERTVSDKLAISVFQSVSTRSGGFTTINYGKTSDATNLGTEALMFIGGASASTAGGIKVGTFAVILVAVIATVRKRRHTRIFARELPPDVVRQALVVGGVAVFTLFGMVFLIAAVEDFALDKIIFETVSALATCGLSTGLSAQMGDWGRGVLVAAMFIGRFGPLTLALLMQGVDEGEPYRFAEERVRIA